MNEKIFIFGIGGLTGSKLVEQAKSDFDVFGSYNLRDPEIPFIENINLDITNTHKVNQILNRIKPNIVINTIGINNVDYCEKNPQEAQKINVTAVRELCNIIKKLDCKLIHLSSDSVFDGNKKSPYVEDDIPNPINYYGKTKLESERIVLENQNNVVVRASVLYGYLMKKLARLESSSKKSINFGQWVINKLVSNEKIRIITDEYSSPIIADDFARTILHIVKHGGNGIFHCAPELEITRYDFSVKLAKSLDLPTHLIEPISNRELGRDVNTGFNKCLDSSKISKIMNYRFWTLDESLNVFRTQFREDT